jgi:uncharacterized protein YbjT (DUF2867 family)
MQPLVRALVTGGAGFLGSHVAEELLRTNAHVVIVDDLSGGLQATPLAEGLRRTVRWAWTAKPRDVRRFANIEIRQGLPPSWN